MGSFLKPFSLGRHNSKRLTASDNQEDTKADVMVKCPIAHSTWDTAEQGRYKKTMKPIPLKTMNGIYAPSRSTYNLLQEIGGKDRVIGMVNRFYEHAFKDKLLDTFIADHNEPHGERLGLWIAEKMGDEGVWTDVRPPHARQSSHFKAWYSIKREQTVSGSAFSLPDCIVWMRLMFLAAREDGLMNHSVFGPWFVDFIAHFIRIYEYTAPPFAKVCALWSEDDSMLMDYAMNGFSMVDIDTFRR
eukprot:CFRG2056T1